MLPFGLSEQFVFFGLVLVMCLIALVLGAWLLSRQKTYLDSNTGQVVEIEIPALGRFKSNVPALAMVAGPLILVALMTWFYSREPTKLEISGRIAMGDGRGIPGITVGVLPGSHITATTSDGTYSLSIPRNPAGDSYNGITFVATVNPPLFHMGPVTFSLDGRGTFDHAFRRLQ